MQAAAVVMTTVLAVFAAAAMSYAIVAHGALPRKVPAPVLLQVTPFSSFLASPDVSDRLSADTVPLIPAILWRTGPHAINDLPNEALRAMASFTTHASHLQQVYCTDADCRQYIYKAHPEWLEAYDCLVPGAFRSDLWRLVILYDFGGVYCDMGFVAEAPLQLLADPDAAGLVVVIDRLFLNGKRRWLHQAFLACRPRHPAIKAMLDHVLDNIRRRNAGAVSLDITGPVAVGRAFCAYYDIPPSVSLVPGNWLLGAPADNVTLGLMRDGMIDSAHGQPVIRRKFPHYDKVMYRSRFTLRYGELYALGIVFKALPVVMEPGRFPDATTLWRFGTVPVPELPEATRDALASATVLMPLWRHVYAVGDGLEAVLPHLAASGGLYVDATFSVLTNLQRYLSSRGVVLVVDKKTSSVVTTCFGGTAEHPLLRELCQHGAAQISAVVQQVLGMSASDLALAAMKPRAGVRVWFFDSRRGVIVDGASGTPLLSTMPPQALDKVDAEHTLVAHPRHFDSIESL